MSDPTRYTESMPDISYGMDESKKGEYVLYKDYAKLKAENERLREAGAAMYDTAVQDSMGLWLMPAFKRWAKVENEKIQ